VRSGVPGSIAKVALIVLLSGVAGRLAPLGNALLVVRGGATRSVPLDIGRGYPAAPASQLARALGYSVAGERLTLGDDEVRFCAGSPFFSFGREVYQLANPVYGSDSDLMIPISWALDWLPRVRSRRWRNMDGRLVERPSTTLQPPERDAWLVLIDPGHGGQDPGTIGVAGTKEKDVTLAIAQLLAKRLRAETGIEVVLTRDRDTLVALGDRPRITHLKGMKATPDLFISIHGNSMPRKPSSTSGFETYFLAVAKTEQARRVAMRENESLKYEGDSPIEDLDPLQFMLTDLQSTANLQESRLLAATINRRMAASVTAQDRGVKQGPFHVLVNATMPAVLVEVGYLSNGKEEKLLRSPSYQAKISDALADAVVRYLAEYGRRIWSSYNSSG
jgi:N-acetylmuramoyl-L-alanine amidase